jgi:SAM-dependent methyltransferase
MKSEAFDLMEGFEQNHWWFMARNQIVCGTVARLAKPGGDCLDYGCGTGGVTSKLKELGFNVRGADLSDKAICSCRTKGFTVLDLREDWPDRQSADVVLACDVLEHVEDDCGLLTRLRDVLRIGGFFIATVPAYEFLWSGEDYVSEHVRRYTRKALKNRLQDAGYELVRCTYFNTILFPLIVTAIMGKRIFRPRDMYRSNVRAHPNWQNSLLYRLFTLEKGLLPWVSLPFGGSILAVAKRAS